MRVLGRVIPRALRNHRSRMGVAYRRYCLAVVARHGPLPPDAYPWLKAAGRLTLDLDQLHTEAEAARELLMNGAGSGAGRRARNKARTTLRQLERRAARLRASLEAAERRVAELAQTNSHGRPDSGLLDEYRQP